jgi:uncharacterized protein RhaS with RHS repeats
MDRRLHGYRDPTYGRFLQTDPIGSKDDLNLYAYVKGDPVNSTDPTGEATLQVGISGTINLAGFKISGGFGVAVDHSGNIAAYAQGGGLVGAASAVNAGKISMGTPASATKAAIASVAKPKMFEGAGVTVAASNATSVSDLGGVGDYQNASLGAGAGGTIEHFSGPDSAIGTYHGGSITVGQGAGGGVDFGKNITVVSNSKNLSEIVLKPVSDKVNELRDKAVNGLR